MIIHPSSREVLGALYKKTNGMTREELAKYLRRKECSICARIGELHDFIDVAGKRISPITKRKTSVYRLNAAGVKLVQFLKEKAV